MPSFHQKLNLKVEIVATKSDKSYRPKIKKLSLKTDYKVSIRVTLGLFLDFINSEYLSHFTQNA